ncbi:DUF3667 domain-containing protein [Pontibacter oryzae]|uniref:DUF3667 domain-containing protein n=1 Tax=Pontibacter oryzae TaxID=2304593 RepID=A0A399SMM7_9BACT|nr:DUF3667 domain-containing protein [Pontibacter oryzae]RIJ43065.1 DUF3667 domain-containing protein [Pontibacter oryzae]
MKKHYRSEKNCLNCGTTVHDKFCPSCGQENLELHEDFLHLALHSVGHYFHFESKLFNSIVPLFTKPGYLTKEYFAGKRASHLNPVSMYIFISILFFFLFTANTNINKREIIDDNTAAAKPATEKENIRKAVSLAKNKLNEDVTAGEISEKTAAYTYTMLDKTEAALDTSQARPNKAVSYKKPAANAEQTHAAGEEAEETGVIHSLKAKFKEVATNDLSSELFKNKLVSHLPKIMFILLPLFALILKLVHWRSPKLYVEHLIYSIHIHSFMFLFISLLIILSWIMPFLSDWLSLLGSIIILWYIYRSMRNIYGNSRWRTISKFFLLFFAYSFLLFVCSFAVVVVTLYTV